MLMLLLCQGLIFETNPDGGPTVLAFGVLMVFMLITSALVSVTKIVKRLVSPKSQQLSVTKLAFDLLEKETQKEVLQTYSSDMNDKVGLLEIPKDKIEQHMTPEKQEDLSQIQRQSVQVWGS
jgi:hypothetical protein